jgi:TolA-binding protein
MIEQSRRRELAEALSVTWTSDLETQVKARIDREVSSRRRRRKQLMNTTAIVATVLAGGVVFAFARAIEERGSEKPHGAPTHRQPAATPSPSPAPAPGAAPRPAASQPAADAPAPRADRDRAPVSRRPAAKAPVPAAPAVGDPIEALFVEADRARLAGRPGDAVRPLTEIQDRFPQDRRAAIAAFQLGRILADEIRDPARAAPAFDRARALAPDGPLAEDARKRAAEARRAAAATRDAGPPR